MATESYYSADIVKRLKKHEGIFAWKIHDNYAGGVPDIFVEGKVRDIFIEAKSIKLPVKHDTVIKLRGGKYLSDLQQEWGKRRHAKREKGWFLLCYIPEGFVLLDWFDLDRNLTKQHFLDMLMTRDKVIQEIITLVS